MRLTVPIYFLLSFLVFLNFNTQSVYATSSLDNPKDVINNDTPNADNVSHLISFTLPYDAIRISPSDYIIISLANFSNITPPDSLIGNYYGTPQITVVGNDIKITNIALLPGNNLSISGLKATNPGSPAGFDVNIRITEDSDGNIVRNIASVTATKFGGNISVTATIDTPVSSVTFSGNSAPGTLVSITENSNVIGTDTASGTYGLFNKIITGLEPTSHLFTVYGVDTYGRNTSPVNIDIYTPIYQNTSIANILLSPTIQMNVTAINAGDDIIASGSALPGGSVQLFTESPLRTYYASSSALGLWEYTINDTADYLPGDYRLYAMVHNGNGLQSLFSPSLQFTVSSSSSGGGSVACDISKGDLNCDNNINLNDFSILMYYWGGSNATADINSDGSVNLNDFSILMYYWGS